MFLRNLIFGIKERLMPVFEGTDAQRILFESVSNGKPLMVARFGATEIKAVLYGYLPTPFNLLVKQHSIKYMPIYSGFFPATSNSLKRFSRLMIEAIRYLDILASWRPEEIFFKKRLKHSTKVTLITLDPNKTKYSWSQSLKGKKVLVIHPFATTIKSQYEKNRSKLFGEYSDYVLPEFASLQVIPAVQTIAGNQAGFETWFDALEYMKREIDKCDFDVALIGCGAYGFPLAAYCKKIGKQGIHIGGPLQLYFGIKGKRWDDKGFYNEYWVSPDESEKPKNLEKVEGGCYW